MKLLEILNKRRIFKLVLGLGNQSEQQIRDCANIFAVAGCDMFDINPSVSAINALFSGIRDAGKSPEDFFLCLSAGIDGDPHTLKAFVDSNKCNACEKCVLACPQKAISFVDNSAFVNSSKCIGCKRCKCPAISYKSTLFNLGEVVALSNKFNADCIELHISSNSSPLESIKYIVDNSDALLSLCLDRKYYSNNDIENLIRNVIKINKSTNFIIQADGVPMSGGDDSFSSTLQAVAMAHLVQKFGTYILISGGTNSKTALLADMCGINFHGVSVGSFARKIVFNSSDPLSEAKNLVDSLKKNY